LVDRILARSRRRKGEDREAGQKAVKLKLAR
jgi:hypothetical protein